MHSAPMHVHVHGHPLAHTHLHVDMGIYTYARTHTSTRGCARTRTHTPTPANAPLARIYRRLPRRRSGVRTAPSACRPSAGAAMASSRVPDAARCYVPGQVAPPQHRRNARPRARCLGLRQMHISPARVIWIGGFQEVGSFHEPRKFPSRNRPPTSDPWPLLVAAFCLLWPATDPAQAQEPPGYVEASVSLS